MVFSSINGMAFPMLLLAVALFFLVGRFRGKVPALLLWSAALLLAALGSLIPLYYLHLFDRQAWYYEFRSWSGTELTAAGIAPLFGLVAAWNSPLPRLRRAFLLAILLLLVAAPHLKPVVVPLEATVDRWRDGICLQSTGSTCGPASAATLLHAAGVEAGEAELARECHTYGVGTENWYLARALRRRGFEVVYVVRDPAEAVPLPVPSIAGVGMGGAGHFVPILAETETAYVTGDPISGRQEYAKDRIAARYHFTGFFMEVRKAAP